MFMALWLSIIPPSHGHINVVTLCFACHIVKQCLRMLCFRCCVTDMARVNVATVFVMHPYLTEESTAMNVR